MKPDGKVVAREVPAARAEELSALFPGPQPALVITSVAEGNTPARAWRLSDSCGAGEAALLWDRGNNVLYLAGAPITPDVAGAIGRLVDHDIRPQALETGCSWFTVYCLDQRAEAALPRIFGRNVLASYRKKLYRFQRPEPMRPMRPDVDDLDLVPIDGRLLDSGLANIDGLRSEVVKMWGSVSRFLERGFGTAALVPGQLLCWCTAEFVSSRQCGIGIETVESHQNHGIASATAAVFLAYCLERSITAHWECESGNIPSVRVAEKAGFTLLEERTARSGRFDNR